MKVFNVASVASLLIAAPFATALCPFKRAAGLGGGDLASLDPVKVRQLLDKLDLRDLPSEHEQAEHLQKRQTATFSEAQEIDVSGVHAYQAPGPNDM